MQKYPYLDNMVRGYFNQDALSEVGSYELPEIMDFYLEDMPKGLMANVINETRQFARDHESNLDEELDKRYYSYLRVSPGREFFTLLETKIKEKYDISVLSDRDVPPKTKVRVAMSVGGVFRLNRRRGRLQKLKERQSDSVFGKAIKKRIEEIDDRLVAAHSRRAARKVK